MPVIMSSYNCPFLSSLAIGTKSLTVSWNMPQFNADGSAIGTITNQTVDYDTVSRIGTGVPYANTVAVGDGVSTSKVVTGLFASTLYYFSVRSLVGGIWSDSGNETSATTAP